ncbi:MULTISPECIES: TetR/AcrR family transcriptional regulator [unclassified Mesorhizobium]|uniref:TetR/AcrR family transcriptional regulator n=1 Tax=unclassified Mesorhizobium TaxID=325217 RepID=UPI000FD802AB|nr:MULTISPECIES: TetR/AcrR family transcriptional regulator [unclassified Mesorhizobium]TGQ45801.1 TetR/AcrR family transcriptional regulator [Mesorhizobium sp. M00.F.Ca.ET.216.01.1.1]TIS56357.1 MAG: TetR family transcriptional regulator [Mesorhizobium sp.]TIS90963.1 MAG: TetR family transcriptional regulator [Mesorhizobium sp.]TJW12958.1 MAG: TetR family transcriptional regulator [Mesorhizobium sp.]TJW48109.1 MAG: TetR family transcriptional regulator [Mesorhizobium sp.]
MATEKVGGGSRQFAAEEVDSGEEAAKGPRRGASRNPQRTYAAILEAATEEFAANGFGGARVDAVAARAQTNKRMLYHYFGDKEALYLAVLEATYASIRSAEKHLDLAHRDPEEGIRELAMFTWDYFLKHPEFLSLLVTENLHKARFLKRSKKITEMHSHFIGELSDVLRRGAEQGVFQPNIDPVSVYLTIAALGFFYLSNRHTLSTIFERDLSDPEALKAWGEHIVAVTLSSIRA